MKVARYNVNRESIKLVLPNELVSIKIRVITKIVRSGILKPLHSVSFLCQAHKVLIPTINVNTGRHNDAYIIDKSFQNQISLKAPTVFKVNFRIKPNIMLVSYKKLLFCFFYIFIVVYNSHLRKKYELC